MEMSRSIAERIGGAGIARDRVLAAGLAFGLALANGVAHPQEQDAANQQGPSAAEVAARLADPNTTLGSLAFNLDSTAYAGDVPGAGDQTGWRLSFQPVLPYPLAQGTNLFVRPLIPIVLQQPVPVGDAGFEDVELDLGDIAFDAAVGRNLGGGLVVLGGVVGSLPTATDDAAGADEWRLGPEAMVAVSGGFGSAGILVNHQWDVAGGDGEGTSITGGQYFYTFNLGKGWQVQASPTFSYDHKAASGQEWTIPAGVGLAKTAILGGTPWKYGVQYWHYLEQPDAFGPDWQIRISVTSVVPLPWG